jgi:hypothetical protein
MKILTKLHTTTLQYLVLNVQNAIHQFLKKIMYEKGTLVLWSQKHILFKNRKKKSTTTIGTLLEGYTCALLLGVYINKIIKFWKLEYFIKN